MKLEDTYCRRPLAAAINPFPGARWVPTINAGMYDSGRPDGQVLFDSRHAWIECKAGAGSMFLGDPDKPQNTAGFHAHQRNWYKHVAQPTGSPYYLYLWMYPSTKLPNRIYQKDATCFLLKPEDWFAAERSIEKKTIKYAVALQFWGNKIVKFNDIVPSIFGVSI